MSTCNIRNEDLFTAETVTSEGIMEPYDYLGIIRVLFSAFVANASLRLNMYCDG